jgi:formamidopyrimidine-DNA glycosylase
MPELPEVETIRLSLAKKIIGLSINKIEILNPKTFQGDSQKVINQKILNVWRRGKGLGIDFENGQTLLFHLKMSGQVIVTQNETRKTQYEKRFVGGHPTKDMLAELPNKSTRVIFYLSDGQTMFFNDQRKFGWIKILDRQSLQLDKFLNNLGPEPLTKDYSWHQLKINLIKHPKTAIKVGLLDQAVVAGVGNIYACEGCYNAGIDPRIKIKDLIDEQFKKLHQGVIQALQDGVKYGGSTKTHFVDSDGKKGLFLDYAKVYNRDKKPCMHCQTPIKKIKLGGRGTFFCPQCQK